MQNIKQTKLPLGPPHLRGKGTLVNRGSKNLGFTLVELIVVVTILAILATIGFVSYSSYLTGVRDTNRISQLSSISDGLNLYSTKNSLPLPEDSVEVQTNTQIIAYQGYAGSNTLETIDFTKGGIDPKDDSYFSYYLTKDRNHFQLMAFLEEADSLAFVPSPGRGGLGSAITHAADYSDRHPTVTGRKLGILTDESNSPIQEVVTDALDITTSTTGYIAYLTNDDTVTGESLLSINPKASCKRIKQMKGSSQDGTYEINPTGAEDAEFDVYCDMTTDGGGWTFFMQVSGTTTTGDFFENSYGNYSADRSDDSVGYSIGNNQFSHTEMMVTVGETDPIEAEENSQLVFYKYDEGYAGMNNGPIGCSGLTSAGIQYKIKPSDTYVTTGTTALCSVSSWYPYSSTNGYLVLLTSAVNHGTYWGSGIGGDDFWYHSSWWYLR